MRAWLVVCAALALAPCRATAATPAHAHRPPQSPHNTQYQDPQRLERIKSQILAKLGLSSRPTPLGAPPRDVVRQILARAADPRPPPRHPDTDNEHAMREIIAIAHRDKNPAMDLNQTVTSLLRELRLGIVWSSCLNRCDINIFDLDCLPRICVSSAFFL